MLAEGLASSSVAVGHLGLVVEQVAPLVASILLLLPIGAGLAGLHAAVGWRRQHGSWDALRTIAALTMGGALVFHLFLVSWLTGSGRLAGLFSWPLAGDALLYAEIMAGLGLALLVLWLGVLQGSVRESGTRAEEVEGINRRLRHRTQELEEFSYAVSHDLRSPLISLQWLTEELQVETQEEERRRLTERVARNVGQMTALVEDLLLLAQVELEAATETMEDVLAAAVEAREVLAPLARRRDVEIAVEMCHGARVRLPRIRLRQVLQNLMANAVQHGREGGMVRVSCHEAQEPDQVRFEVADDGPGIPPHAQDAVFAAFVRGPRAHEDGPGSGIGLALVRKIARAYGGRAWVEDAPEGGACFCVILPGEVEAPPPTEDTADSRVMEAAPVPHAL